MTSAETGTTETTGTQQTTGNRAYRSLSELRAEIEQEMAGMPLLGWMLTWSIRKTVIGVPDLVDLLAKHNIAGVDVKPVRDATALRRALASLTRLQKDQIIQKVRDDADRLVFVVGEIQTDDIAETLGLRPGMKVAINRQATAGQDPLEFADRASDEALRPVIKMYADAWVSRDISDKVLRETVRRARGFRGREDGGVYFLFASEKDVLFGLLGLVQDLAHNQHNGSYLTYVPVPDLRSAKGNLGRHAHDTVMAELDQLMNDLKRFEDDEAREKARPSTIGDMLVHIDQVLGATDLYASKLDYSLDDVRVRAGRVRAMARAVLNDEAPSVAGKRYDAAQSASAEPAATETEPAATETEPAAVAAEPAPAETELAATIAQDADLEELGEMLAAIGG